MSDEAITWFAKLQAEDVTRQDRKDFFLWLGINDEHQLAFLEILTLRDTMAVISTMDFPELQNSPIIFDFKRKQVAMSSS